MKVELIVLGEQGIVAATGEPAQATAASTPEQRVSYILQTFLQTDKTSHDEKFD